MTCTNPQEPETYRDYDSLIWAASETSMNFKSSEISRPSGVFVEVPEEFWAQEIKDENPIKVYSHNSNIALVFIETKKTEQGIYIHVPFSSYMPINNDKVTFTIVVNTYSIYIFIKEK